MERLLFLALCWFAALGLSTSVGIAMAGIWLGSGRAVGMATVLMVTAAISTVAASLWHSGGAPPPNQSRAVRKRMQQERERVELEAYIKRIEREEGLG
jgi:hypothetical protein